MNVTRNKIFNIWFWGLLALIASRFAFLLLALNDYPAGAGLDSAWWTTYGGDELNYFRSAQLLLSWDFMRASPIGYCLILAPLLVFSRAETFLDVAWLAVFVNSVVFYGLALVLVYFLAKKFLLKKWLAFLAAAAFNFYPYIFFYFFKWFAVGDAKLAAFTASRFRQLMFFPVLSDPWSLVLMLASLLLILRIYKNDGKFLPLLAGGLTAWAVLTRLQNAPIIPLYYLILFWGRRFKNAAYFALGWLPLTIFHLYVNFRSNGSIFKTSYDSRWAAELETSVVSVKNLFKIFEYAYAYNPGLLAVLAILAPLIIIGLIAIIKRFKDEGWILAAYFIGIVGFISILAPTSLNPRYFLPVIPAAIIIIFVAVDAIYKKIKNEKINNPNSVL